MNIVFQINGGMGKCIMATAVCEAIKKQYPDANLIVISGYPDVFLNNPNIKRNYSFNGFSYFYEEQIDNKDFLIFAHDPYLETNHIKQSEHLIETWCKMFNINYNGEQPIIYLNNREKKFYSNKYLFNKPILLLQSNGGASSEMKYSWARDLPTSVSLKVIEEFKNDFTIVHIRRDDQTSFENTIPITDNFRSMAVLIDMSSKRLLIDSFGQHTAAALGLKSTVCWIANKPEIFGYQLHDNIVSEPFTIKPDLRK